MSSFKLKNLTPQRAAEIRRGIVSGKILVDTVTNPSSGLTGANKGVWLAKKLDNYSASCETYLEREALHRTVLSQAAKKFSSAEADAFCHYVTRSGLYF